MSHACSHPHCPPQEFKKAEAKERADAITYRKEHAASSTSASSSGTAAAAPSSGSTAASSGGLVALPAKLSFASSRPFLPQVKGASLWHEPQTGRCRVQYTRGGVRSTHSADLAKTNLHDAIVYCLKWAWEEHRDATGNQSPWPALRK